MPYKNSEKRKEKSRDAARCRRSKETEVFFELSNSLPLPPSVTSQLDKASVMRLSISFLKICNILDQHNWTGIDSGKLRGEKQRMEQLYPKALDGFVFILSREGDIVYVNESVAKYLGIQQIELMGQSMYDFAHPCDHEEIREILSARPHGHKAPVAEERVFYVRMKCTLTSKGRNVNLKSASYKVMKCTGRLVVKTARRSDSSNVPTFPYLLSVAEAIPHPSNIEIPMDSNTFLSKHDMDMHFTYCDDRVKDLINYTSDELIGKSLYDYHHALDSDVVEKAYKDLFAKGQTMTGQYRFLARGGGMAWVITQATVIYNSRSQKAQWVVCVHYVISRVEHKELVLSQVQLPDTACLPGNIQLRTESLFSRKTEDMDEGYFVPPEMRDTMNYVNNEPEDLSYLAPTAGEGSVPLGFPLFSQVALAERDDERALSSPPALLTVGLKKEPCLTPPDCGPRNRDNISSGNPSPASVSTSCTSSRINSPHDYLTTVNPDMVMSMDKFFQAMDTKPDSSTRQEVEAIDFDARAPYIPMSGDEDFSLLPPSTESLLTMQNEMNPGLFGKTESVFKSKSELFEEPPQPPRQSVRDMISGSTAVASIERPPDTMFQQIKRPLDMNSLEKGPPAHKMLRLAAAQVLAGTRVPEQSHVRSHAYAQVQGLSSKDSVLLNLLLTGEDPNHGYKVKTPSVIVPGVGKRRAHDSLMRPELLCLTQRDCEVNAPARTSALLQGADLIRALEIDLQQMQQTPH